MEKVSCLPETFEGEIFNYMANIETDEDQKQKKNQNGLQGEIFINRHKKSKFKINQNILLGEILN